MPSRLLLSLAVAALTLASSRPLAADDAPQFPQPGSTVPGSFTALVLNGSWKDADGKPVDRFHSLVTHFGLRPTFMVLAKDARDEAVWNFLKKLEAKTRADKDVYLSGFAVFLSHDDLRDSTEATPRKLIDAANAREALVEELKEKTRSAGLKNILVGIGPPDGPKGFPIDKKADVTVVVYYRFKVAASYGLGKGELNDETTGKIFGEVDRLVADLRKAAAAKK
jgi:hypothetical protein